MNRKCTLLLAVLGLGFAGSVGAGEAGDPQAGRTKAAMCQGCHGIEGYRMAFPSNRYASRFRSPSA